MQSPKHKRGVVDLRGKRVGANSTKPPQGQQALFAPRAAALSRRASPLRAKRRRMLALKVLAVLIVIGGIAWGISYVSYLPSFTIQTIRVSGAHDVPADLIERYAWTVLQNGSRHYLSRANVLLYPGPVIEHDIVSDFPRIRSAVVSRPSLLSTTMDITVEERAPFALWCTSATFDGSERCYQMDDTGFIFAEAPDSASSTPAASAYVFRGTLGAASTTQEVIGDPIGHAFAPAHLSGLAVLLRLLGQAGFTPLGASITDGEDFTVPLQEGFYLKASFGADAATLVRDLQLVLSSDALQGKQDQLEYVDLRFGDRVYYKLNGQDEVGAQ